MNNDIIKNAINDVYNDLKVLSKSEFSDLLLKHQDGDIANILIDSQALLGREIESIVFQNENNSRYIFYNFAKTFNTVFFDFDKDYINKYDNEIQSCSHILFNASIQLNIESTNIITAGINLKTSYNDVIQSIPEKSPKNTIGKVNISLTKNIESDDALPLAA